MHHSVLLCTPVAVHRLMVAGRFAPPRPAGAGLLQYVAFAYAFIGTLLCAASLAVGRNLNYSLWPPKLPAWLIPLLGGTRYRRAHDERSKLS